MRAETDILRPDGLDVDEWSIGGGGCVYRIHLQLFCYFSPRRVAIIRCGTIAPRCQDANQHRIIITNRIWTRASIQSFEKDPRSYIFGKRSHESIRIACWISAQVFFKHYRRMELRWWARFEALFLSGSEQRWCPYCRGTQKRAPGGVELWVNIEWDEKRITCYLIRTKQCKHTLQ